MIFLFIESEIGFFYFIGFVCLFFAFNFLIFFICEYKNWQTNKESSDYWIDD